MGAFFVKLICKAHCYPNFQLGLADCISDLREKYQPMTSKSVVRKKNVRLIAEQIYSCPTCGNTVEKNFCDVCGEKKLNRHDFSFSHFVEEAFEGFTHFDNKFFRTAHLLIFKPGQLTVDFCEGRRVLYLKAFPMFIICNILFFLFVGEINIFAQPLSSFYQYMPYTNFNTREIIHALVKSDPEFKTLAIAFDQRIGIEAKAFLAIFIPILALGSLVVNYRRGTYFSEHLVFSTHYFSFMIMLYTVWTLIVTKPYYLWIHAEQADSYFDLVTSFVCITMLAVYFGMASRRFFRVSRLRSIVGSVVIAMIFMLSLMAYRMFLFYKIIYSLQ